MCRLPLQLTIIILVAAAQAYAQPVRTMLSEPSLETCSRDDVPSDDVRCNDVIAYRALTALQQLRNDVVIYRSAAQFDGNGKLARVTLQTFQENLAAMRADFEPLLLRLPSGKTRTALLNALYSFRDGVFWWQKIPASRTVHISALAFEEARFTPADAALVANAPYTVANHWRLADRYLRRAASLMAGTD